MNRGRFLFAAPELDKDEDVREWLKECEDLIVAHVSEKADQDKLLTAILKSILEGKHEKTMV